MHALLIRQGRRYYDDLTVDRPWQQEDKLTIKADPLTKPSNQTN